MANLRNRNPNNSDGRYNESDNILPEEVVEPSRVASYRDGYVHGRVSERRQQDEVLEVRDNNNAARGLLIGISLASLLGLGLAALFFWNQRPEEAPTQIIVPQSVSPSPSPQSAETQNRTTVIERQVESVPQVVIPQQPASAPQQSAPKININVPRQAAPPAPKTDIKVTVPSATQQAPAPKQDTTVNVTPPQSSTQRSETSSSTSSNPKANPINPSQSTQNQTDTQSGTDSTP